MRATLIAFALLLLPGLAPASSTSTGIDRDFNPAISANSLILYSSGILGEAEEHEGEDEHDHGLGAGLHLQETELQLSANVDPYSKAVLTLAMHGTSGIELEEGYLQTLRLPLSLQLRAGQFYWEFGKHNSFHTHQYPFVERPQAWDELLGEHGLGGVALELSWLSPLPWFAEITGTAFPLNHAIYGESAEVPENVWGGSARLRQLFEVSERSTLEPLRGTKIVAYHQMWAYPAARFGFEIAGHVEDRPGIPPTPRHLLELVRLVESEGIRLLIYSDLVGSSGPERFAERAGCHALRLPQSLGSREGTGDLVSWFERWVLALEAVAKED